MSECFLCNIGRFYLLRKLYEADLTNPVSMEAGEYELTWDMFRRVPSRGGRGPRAAVDFVVCFGWGGFFFFSSSNAHGLLQV